MVPTDFVSLILSVAVLAPGMVWLVVSERRAPRAQRSGVLEVSGLVIVGAVASAAAIGLTSLIGEIAGRWYLDVGAWIEAERSQDFLRVNLEKGIVSGFTVVGLGLLLAWAAARLAYWGKSADISPHTTVWFEVLGKARVRRQAFLGVHLDDGSVLEGYLHAYPTDTTEGTSDLSLKRPIFLRSDPTQERLPMPNLDHIIVQGDSISHIGVLFLDAETSRADH